MAPIRLDPERVDPAWPTPVAPGDSGPPSPLEPTLGPAVEASPPAPPSRRLPTAARYGIVVLALALIVTGCWALGGFKKRTDLLSDVAPGTTVTTGPYTFTFTEVTAQRTTNYKDEVVWKLIAIGTGSSDDDRTGAPDYDDTGSFVSRDDTSKEVQTPSSITFGENGALGQNAFTPGLPAVPFTVVFDFSERYQPQATLRFVVLDLEKRDSSLLGDGEEDWHSTGFGYSYQLPIRVLPEKTT